MGSEFGFWAGRSGTVILGALQVLTGATAGTREEGSHCPRGPAAAPNASPVLRQRQSLPLAASRPGARARARARGVPARCCDPLPLVPTRVDLLPGRGGTGCRAAARRRRQEPAQDAVHAEGHAAPSFPHFQNMLLGEKPPAKMPVPLPCPPSSRTRLIASSGQGLATGTGAGKAWAARSLYPSRSRKEPSKPGKLLLSAHQHSCWPLCPFSRAPRIYCCSGRNNKKSLCTSPLSVPTGPEPEIRANKMYNACSGSTQ